MKIEALVAKVLSDGEVVLNRGRTHGVDVGMIFEIHDARLDDIKDPETGKDLGPIGGDRAAFEVIRLGDKACLAIRYRPAGDLSIGLSPWSLRPRGVLDADDWERIKVGDAATYTGRKATRLY